MKPLTFPESKFLTTAELFKIESKHDVRRRTAENSQMDVGTIVIIYFIIK